MWPPAGVRSRLRRGFALAEAMASLGAAAVLVVALGGAMTLASRALSPDSDDQVRPAWRWVDRLADELEEAVAIESAGNAELVFLVPDRDGDGAPERIAYWWIGQPGASLWRSAGGVETVVVQALDAFDVSAQVETLGETYAAPPPPQITVSPLFEHLPTDGLGLLNAQDSRGYAQVFKPSLPVSAATWRVSKAWVLARRAGSAGGGFRVEVRAVEDGATPGLADAALESVVVAPEAVPNALDWVEVEFSQDHALTAGGAAAIAVLHDDAGLADDQGVDIEFSDSDVDLGAGAGLFETQSDGALWEFRDGEGLHFAVEGSYSEAATGDDPQLQRTRVTGVTVSLTTTGAAAPATRSFALLNQPQRLEAEHRADFSQSVLAEDANADGAPDWTTTTGIKLAGRTQGIWQVSTAGLLSPRDENTESPATLDLWMRQGVVGAPPGGADWVLDASGGALGRLALELSAIAGGQSLELAAYTGVSTRRVLYAETDLAGGAWVHARLLVDPTADTVNLHVDGQDRGTFYYPRFVASLEPLLRVGVEDGETADGFEVDEVWLRVGGEVR